MRDGSKRTSQARNLVVRIERVGIKSIAQAKSPGQVLGDFPGVLRVQIEIQKIERLIRRLRKCLGGRGRYAINVLRQSRINDRRHAALAEIVIVQPQNSRVGAEAQLVRPMAPGQIVVDEKARSPPTLNPGVV